MKRSTSSKGSSTHAPSDFKRLKAKVGKRAPRKVNHTETSFRTASIQVRTQSIAPSSPFSSDTTDISTLQLISARGKALRDLAAQLNHAAPNARLSALQGIKDAAALSPLSVSTLTNHPNKNSTYGVSENVIKILPAIQANLSILIPSLSKCFIDEDGKVRSLAKSLLFQELVPRIALMASEATAIGRRPNGVEREMKLDYRRRVELDWDLSMMQCFLPLIVAYLTSALHSLDSDIRYDGAIALELLCTRCVSLFVADDDSRFSSVGNRVGNRSVLNETLSAFGRLIEDAGGFQNGGGCASSGIMAGAIVGRSSAKKRRIKERVSDVHVGHNREKKGDSTRVVGVLRAFISVLKIVGSCSSIVEEDIYVVEGASSREEEELIKRNESANGTLAADLKFLPGGRTSNALVIIQKKCYTGGRVQPIINKLSDLSGFFPLPSPNYFNSKSNYNQKEGTSLPLVMLRDLLSKLRDRLVEVSQRGHLKEGNGLFLSFGNLEEFSLVLTSLRLVWNEFCRLNMFQISLEDERKKINLLGISIQNLFLESLPVRDKSGNSSNIRRYDLLNASVCCAISEFGSTLLLPAHGRNERNIKQSTVWVDGIFTYLLPRLESEKLHLVQDTKFAQSSEIAPSTNSNCNAKVALLKVISQLLVRDTVGLVHEQQQLSPCPLEDNRKRMQLLQKFGDAFFHYNNNLDSIGFLSVSKLAEIRRAAAILTTLITQHILVRNNHNNIKDVSWLDTWERLAEMASILPVYLKAWRGAYPQLSSVMLSALLSIVRQYTPSNPDFKENKLNKTSRFESINSQLCDSLRVSVTGFFLLSTKKRRVGDKTYRYKISIFEELSEVVQRLIIGLVGMLKYPSEALVLSLSKMCAHTSCISLGAGKDISLGLNDSMIDYIMSVLHLIRRAIPLQLYLTFLINSNGINEAKYLVKERAEKCDLDGKSQANTEIAKDKRENKSSASNESNIDTKAFDVAFINSYDRAITRSCRYLKQCGGVKILLMLRPVLSSWLAENESKNVSSQENGSIMLQNLKSRAALSIFSCFYLGAPNQQQQQVSEFFHQEVENGIKDNAAQAKVVKRLNALQKALIGYRNESVLIEAEKFLLLHKQQKEEEATKLVKM